MRDLLILSSGADAKGANSSNRTNFCSQKAIVLGLPAQWTLISALNFGPNSFNVGTFLGASMPTSLFANLVLWAASIWRAIRGLHCLVERCLDQSKSDY